ncbi:hypothetical protein [Methanocella sp. MCL-LM]|uniref:hypothetical protein n=1 Tax=Methanocella sp. MCL-LM TaxID=3412035 RepID=UPI003C771BB0
MHVTLAEFYLYLTYLLIILGVAACLYGIFVLPVLIGLLAANIFCLMLVQAMAREDCPSGISAKFLRLTGF